MTIRDRVRGQLRSRGLDVVRYDPTRMPAGRRAALIAERRGDVALDVGANDGAFGRGLRDAGFAGRIVSFEPQRSAFDALASAARSDPMWECHRLALGSADGEQELHVAGNSSSSSLLEMTQQHVASAPESRYVSSECVPVARLDTIRDEVVRAGERVYLKLDVQGLELEVLAGAERLLDQVVLVESELSFARLYEGGAPFAQVVAHLEERGFHLLSVDPVFVDPGSGRLLQVDGVFGRAGA
jgi:FkbM family methyltransferase